MKLDHLQALRRGKVVVFTNGVFDILHAGHVRLLEQARSLGDLLVVGVNSDSSVRRLNKGPGRPINSLSDRVAVLERLRSVDFVMPFDEDTPLGLIQQLRPDIHVKGGDYAPALLPEGDAVLQMGGSICILPLLEDRSTTAVVKKISGL